MPYASTVVLSIHLASALLMALVLVSALVCWWRKSMTHYRTHAYVLALLFALASVSGTVLAVVTARPVITVCDNLALYLCVFAIAEYLLLRTASVERTRFGLFPVYASAGGSISFLALMLVFGF